MIYITNKLKDDNFYIYRGVYNLEDLKIFFVMIVSNHYIEELKSKIYTKDLFDRD